MHMQVSERSSCKEEATNQQHRVYEHGCEAKSGQMDGRSPHTVAGTLCHGKDEQYVVWDGSGFSLIRRS
jgi:hypothetical protein